MSRIAYFDFDLQIQREGAGYCAQVLNSPGGQGKQVFQIPFSDQDLEIFFLRFGRSPKVRGLDSPEMEAAKTFGQRLFTAIFEGEVRDCLRSSLDEAARQPSETGLRIRLRFKDAPELTNLPWEYFYNPAFKRFLALSVGTPLVRYLDLPEPIRPPLVTTPLRVLVMISSPTDYQHLNVENEWKKLGESVRDLEASGALTVERLKKGTLEELQRQLRKDEYHIFHFVGHGGFDEQRRDSVLVLEDESGRGRRVSGQELGTMLHDERTLRLAVLNACEGARSSRDDPFAGVAQSLVQQGIPAVIAMQFEITDEAAIIFAREFYAGIADGYPVDAALAEARKAIYASRNALEWGTPVLYLRAPDGRVFDVQAPSVQQRPKVDTPAVQGQVVQSDESSRVKTNAEELPKRSPTSESETPQQEKQQQQPSTPTRLARREILSLLTLLLISQGCWTVLALLIAATDSSQESLETGLGLGTAVAVLIQRIWARNRFDPRVGPWLNPLFAVSPTWMRMPKVVVALRVILNWALWLVLGSIGGAAITIGVLEDVPHRTPPAMWGMWYAAACGASLGIAQWDTFRARLPGTAWWILLNTVSWGAGGYLLAHLIFSPSSPAPQKLLTVLPVLAGCFGFIAALALLVLLMKMSIKPKNRI